MLLTHQQATTESQRCLYCFDAPCTLACPVHIDIPKFISMIKSGNVIGAAKVVKTSHALANVCGKVCPEEIFCQSACNRAKQDSPIQIRELHFFATQHEARKGFSALREFPKVGRKIAVIGAGPAGLGCAFELSKLGYEVHVYDAKGCGGVPKNSIPAFRLSEEELRSDIEFIAAGLQLHEMSVDSEAFGRIRQHHDATFIAVGLGLDKKLGVMGEETSGVFPVLEFLGRARKNELRNGVGDRVVIVGGGNVSLDAAATARHLGATDVVLVYRRSEKELKVWKSELWEAKKLGVQMQFLTQPMEILGAQHVTGLRCRKTRLLAEVDSSGRPVPVEVPNSDFVLDADTVVVAIGQQVHADFVRFFERTKQGFIKVDEMFRTSLPGIYAGGDAIAGEGTIVQAVADGKQAAHAMHEYLRDNH